MKMLISEFMDERAMAQLAACHDVDYAPTLVDDMPRLIVRNRTQVRGDLLVALTRCKVNGRLGVVLDNIDVPACTTAPTCC